MSLDQSLDSKQTMKKLKHTFLMRRNRRVSFWVMAKIMRFGWLVDDSTRVEVISALE